VTKLNRNIAAAYGVKKSNKIKRSAWERKLGYFRRLEAELILKLKTVDHYSNKDA
jgi:hypothetical protein